MPSIDEYLSMDHPGPGSGPSRGSGGSGHARRDLATVVALCILKRGKGTPVSWTELLDGSAWSEFHARANAFGDSVGVKYLALDRGPRNAIVMAEPNLTRAAHWLRDVGSATATVALYFPGRLAEGDDLIGFVESGQSVGVGVEDVTAE